MKEDISHNPTPTQTKQSKARPTKVKMYEMSDTKPNQVRNLLNPRQSMKTEPHSLYKPTTTNTYRPTIMDSKDQVCEDLQELN